MISAMSGLITASQAQRVGSVMRRDLAPSGSRPSPDGVLRGMSLQPFPRRRLAKPVLQKNLLGEFPRSALIPPVQVCSEAIEDLVIDLVAVSDPRDPGTPEELVVVPLSDAQSLPWQSTGGRGRLPMLQNNDAAEAIDVPTRGGRTLGRVEPRAQ